MRQLRSVTLATILLTGTGLGSLAHAGHVDLYGIDQFDSTTLYQISKTDGSEINSITITGIPGLAAGAEGLTLGPSGTTAYAIVKDDTDFNLATIDYTTGVGSVLGGMGDEYFSLALDGSGSLYTIAGLNASNPYELSLVDTATGATSSSGLNLDRGSVGGWTDLGGEFELAYNRNDGLLYYLHDVEDDATLDVALVMDTIDLSGTSPAFTMNRIFLSGYGGGVPDGFSSAFTYDWQADRFYLADELGGFYRIALDGTLTQGAFSSWPGLNNAGALAAVPLPSSLFLLVPGLVLLRRRGRL